MSSSDSRLRMLLLECERKRNYAEEKAEEKKRQLFERFPELEEIESERAKIGLNSIRRIITLGGDKEKLKEEMDLEFRKLKEREENIYIKNGIPFDYLDVKYECKICNDRGILKEGGKCKCIEQKLIESYYDKSNMKNLLLRQNFDTLDESLYSDEICSPEEGISQKELMLQNIAVSKQFIENINDVSELSLVFYGPSGSGKTFLSSCIADKVIRQGYTVMYKPCAELMQLASKNQFGKYEDSVSEEYDKLFSCDLLIIDDLGTEMATKFTISEIYKIINSRIVSGKKFIISTNLTPRQINEQYTSRVSYRLLESCKMIEFIGPNLRTAQFKRN